MMNKIKKIALFLPLFVFCGFDTLSPDNKSSKHSANDMILNGYHQLPNVIFWRKIMNLDKDSCLLNIQMSRQILCVYHVDSWARKTPAQKLKFADSLKSKLGISDSNKVVGTSGKSFFYLFEKVADKIPKGIEAFENNGVDGFYAKAILLIESPNQLQKSNVGAYGPFQLMKGVAKMYGLKVNKKVDERANFNRSAYAASELIKKVCIPKTKEMLDFYQIAYDENELWFKLLVMHSYHAGSGNVKNALNAIPVKKKGMELIYQIWNTRAGSFQSASQNYSQLILAAYLEYHYRVELKKINK